MWCRWQNIPYSMEWLYSIIIYYNQVSLITVFSHKTSYNNIKHVNKIWFVYNSFTNCQRSQANVSIQDSQRSNARDATFSGSLRMEVLVAAASSGQAVQLLCFTQASNNPRPPWRGCTWLIVHCPVGNLLPKNVMAMTLQEWSIWLQILGSFL